MTFRSAGSIETILIRKAYSLKISAGNISLLFCTGKRDRVSVFRWIRPGRYIISIKGAYLTRIKNQEIRQSLLLPNTIYSIKTLIII